MFRVHIRLRKYGPSLLSTQVPLEINELYASLPGGFGRKFALDPMAVAPSPPPKPVDDYKSTDYKSQFALALFRLFSYRLKLG